MFVPFQCSLRSKGSRDIAVIILTRLHSRESRSPQRQRIFGFSKIPGPAFGAEIAFI